MKRFALLAACTLAAAACKDSSSPSVAADVSLSTTAVDFDAIGATQTVSAIVRDQDGRTMPNAAVTWTSSTAAATVTPVTATGATASAVVVAALNGQTTIVASVGGARASLAVSVKQTPFAVQKIVGDAQAGAVNQLLAQAIVAKVVDRLGAGIAGQPVTFTVVSGNGTLTQTSATTSGDGLAGTTWTLGRVAGEQQAVSASAPSLAAATFTATAIAGAPTSVDIAEGDGQTGAVGLSLPINPKVVVRDAFGNPVANAIVNFSTTSGAVASPSASTDASGAATSGNWTLGGTVGPNTLTATVSGSSARATFTANAAAGAPATMTLIGNNQTARAGTSVPIAPGVRIVDGFGNPVPGVRVTFTVALGAGSVIGSSPTTDASGTAVTGGWLLGPYTGTNTLTVSANAGALGVRVLTATGTGGAAAGPAPMSVSNGYNQAAMAGTMVPAVPAVTLHDAVGNPAVGVPVTFTVASGGGSVAGARATTDANGVATVGSWTIGAVAGPNTLMATATGYGTATFTAAGCEGGGDGYRITLCYRTAMTTSQHDAFAAAAARWNSIITADVPDLTVHLAEGDCDAGTPSVDMAVDDLLIFAGVEPIDGTGSVLASAGWCFRRTGGLPVVGTMRFDVADVANLESTNRLGAVILHEMGHVLGIGTLWATDGLLQNESVSGTMRDTYFSGQAGIAAFDAVGGTAYTGLKVPVENSGNIGTVNSHWRETVFGNELMTGYINDGANPLSLVTIRSLEDIGYSVNTAFADSYSWKPLGASASAVGSGNAIALDGDTYKGRQGTIDSRGRITRIR